MKDIITSYAQDREDVLIENLLRDLPAGAYLEIGATHPLHDTTTKRLHVRGWRGCIWTPNEAAKRLFALDRPDDTVALQPADAVTGLTRTKLKAFNFVRITANADQAVQLLAAVMQRYSPTLVCLTGEARQAASKLQKSGFKIVATTA